MSDRDVTQGAVRKDALISDCGQYRYWLTRKWDDGAFSLPIIMLNPSTADASIDDPTIRRCMSFARREGFGGIRVMNLFAYRATSPADMRAVSDPRGPDCNAHLSQMLSDARDHHIPVLCAWGAHGDYLNRSRVVTGQNSALRLACLGTTKHGHPRHPLYVPGTQELEPFRP